MCDSIRHCEASEGRRSNLDPHSHEQVERDCFAEFTLGLAEGKTRGLAMTSPLPYAAARPFFFRFPSIAVISACGRAWLNR